MGGVEDAAGALEADLLHLLLGEEVQEVTQAAHLRQLPLLHVPAIRCTTVQRLLLQHLQN